MRFGPFAPPQHSFRIARDSGGIDYARERKTLDNATISLFPLRS
jgi:hypothetical protein